MTTPTVLAQFVDSEAELAYVAAALYDYQVTRMVRVEPSHVASEALRDILTACYATERVEGNWTVATVVETLSRLGALDRVGGEESVAAIRDSVDPQTLMNPERVASRIKLLAVRRRESETAVAFSEALRTGDRARAASMLDALNAIRQTAFSEVEILTSKETTEAAYKYLVDYAESKRQISLGVRELDNVIGRLPAGTMTVIGGSTGCVTGDTMIPTNRGGNGRSYSIKTLYERFFGASFVTDQKDGRVGRTRWWDTSIPTYCQSVGDDGYIRLNKLVHVHYNGVKKVYKLLLSSGKNIKVTANHRFMRWNREWSRLSELRPGDELCIAEWPKLGSAKSCPKRIYKMVCGMKNHPYVQITKPKSCSTVYRVPEHRLICEANMNGISLDEFVYKIRTGNTQHLIFLSKDYHVHHKNRDVKDNSLLNLEVLSPSEHLARHGINHNWKNVNGRVITDVVQRVEYIGEEDVYDLTMDDPMHNYVANGIITHNSGKSQTMLLMALQMAAAGNRPGIISLEDAREEWGGRIIARLTGITFRDFSEAKRHGSEERTALYSRAGEAVDESGKHVFDIAYAISAETDTVIETARKLISERGCNVLFVDYVQAIRIGHEWVKRIDKGVSDAAKRLKGLCSRLKVPLVLGSQLARSNEAPTIHSLKETGDLENEAEAVILLWRKEDGTRNPAVHWKIGKVKWSSARPHGTVLFDKSTGMIEDFVEDNEEFSSSKYGDT